ncbi:antiterminator Q family protein, partial [Salmonella enterica]|uniref:antiterminator Q family protein n=1 Tax=Salmonella enterica TaxID=28901 RepID=UPI000AB3D64A
MSIRELNLTKEQHDWLNGWLELWGAWVYSGRLEKRMSSVIAQFMERVEPSRVMTRPMCNDDDGMLISQVVDSVMRIEGVLEILCHSSNIQSKRNDTCPSPSISIKRL